MHRRRAAPNAGQLDPACLCGRAPAQWDGTIRPADGCTGRGGTRGGRHRRYRYSTDWGAVQGGGFLTVLGLAVGCGVASLATFARILNIKFCAEFLFS